MSSHTFRIGAVPAILLAGTALTFPAASGAQTPAQCQRPTNVEAIIDDSRSMLNSDPDRVRAAALEAFAALPANVTRSMGAVRFGSLAEPLFDPVPLGRANKSLLDALARIQGTGPVAGGTNYNAAFAAAAAHNPGAGARLLLTDGGHNVGAYAEGHRGGPPTYVIGFGDATEPEAAARLQRIADETGGRYYPDTGRSDPTLSQLAPTLTDLAAALNCDPRPIRFTDVLSSGSRAVHGRRIGSRVRRLEIVVTWTDPTASFKLRRVVIRRPRTARVRRYRPRVTIQRGDRFLIARVRRLHPGSLRFAIVPRTPVLQEIVTTQIATRRR